MAKFWAARRQAGTCGKGGKGTVGENPFEIAIAVVWWTCSWFCNFLSRATNNKEWCLGVAMSASSGTGLDVKGKDSIKKLFVFKMDIKMLGAFVHLTCNSSTVKETLSLSFPFKSTTWQQIQSLTFYLLYFLWYTSCPHLIYSFKFQRAFTKTKVGFFFFQFLSCGLFNSSRHFHLQENNSSSFKRKQLCILRFKLYRQTQLAFKEILIHLKEQLRKYLPCVFFLFCCYIFVCTMEW